MLGVLIIAHDNLAQEILASARKITGDAMPFETLTIEWDQKRDEIKSVISDAIEKSRREDGLLVLTDLYGGSAANVTDEVSKIYSDVEVVTGVNLPIVISLATRYKSPKVSVKEIAKQVAHRGATHIKLLSDLSDKPAEADKSETAKKNVKKGI